jgi:hypothetical protein
VADLRLFVQTTALTVDQGPSRCWKSARVGFQRADVAKVPTLTVQTRSSLLRHAPLAPNEQSAYQLVSHDFCSGSITHPPCCHAYCAALARDGSLPNALLIKFPASIALNVINVVSTAVRDIALTFGTCSHLAGHT